MGDELAAEFIGTTIKAIHAWVASGMLKAFQDKASQLRFRRADLVAWKKQHPGEAGASVDTMPKQRESRAAKTAEMTSPKMLNLPAAARFLGLSRQTVSVMAASGELPSFEIGKKRFFALVDLKQFRRSHVAGLANLAPGASGRPAKAGPPLRSRASTGPRTPIGPRRNETRAEF
jgi:predicted DNA-binding transcriptional regulator AlpA